MDETLTKRVEDLEYIVSQMKDTVNSLMKYTFPGSQALTKDTTLVSGFLQSGNYKTLVSGWRINANGSAEFAGTITAGGYIQLFRQDGIPTSLHINDIWIDTNDSNKMYVAASVGADQITAGEWVLTNPATLWSAVQDDDGNKPDNNATVGAVTGTNLVDEGAATLAGNDIKNIRAYTAGETLVAGDTVFMETAIQTISLGGFTNDAGASTSWGVNTGSQQQVAQRFTGVAGSITRLRIRLKKNNTPSDNAVFTIRSGSETGSSLATVSLAGSSITGSFATYDLDLSATVDLVAATTYSIVCSRSDGSINSSDYVVERGTSGAVSGDVTGGQPYFYDGSWASVASTNDFILSLRLTTAVGNVYKTIGGTAATSDGFIGFANAAIARGASGNIRVGGVQTGLTGLTTGAQYRCIASPRGGVETGGTNRKVGIASSTTELTISNIW